MNKIIPFTKEIVFKTMIKEITSISLDHDIKVTSTNIISGEFVIGGTYKMTEASTLEEDFSYNIPVNIELDDKYNTSNCKVFIDDFHYEIINEESLKIYIDLLLDGLEVIAKEEISLDPDIIKKHLDKIDLYVESVKEEKPVLEQEQLIRDTKDIDKKDEVNIMELFNNINNSTKDTYATYSIYFFKEDDTVERLLEKYDITKEELANYNKLEDIKSGSKIVIPCQKTNEKS